MSKILYFMLLSAGLFFTAQCSGQDNQIDNRDPVAMMKANLLFNFANMSEWNEQDQNDKEFVIGVYGNKDIYDHLILMYATQPIGHQILKIKYFDNLKAISDVEVLFVDDKKIADFKKILDKTKNFKTLLVTDVTGGLNRGAAFNFVLKDSGIRYEIDMRKTKKLNITLASKLIDWAVKIIE